VGWAVNAFARYRDQQCHARDNSGRGHRRQNGDHAEARGRKRTATERTENAVIRRDDKLALGDLGLKRFIA
jgi:hypothetical protein